MNVYTAEFHGVWLAGYAVVIARGDKSAMKLLLAALAAANLPQAEAPTLTLFCVAASNTPATVKILANGDY